MAPSRIHPVDAPRPGAPHSERCVWEALKRGLPPGWQAWHSLRLRDRKGYLGEGDFILAHPERGLLVIEVKGGRLEQRDGRWFSNGVALEKAPLDQAHELLRKLLGRLADSGCQPPAWGVAVAFPDTEFEEGPGQDDLRGVVLGATQLHWFSEFFPGVVERALPAPKPGLGRFVELVHGLWGESWVPSLSLGIRARRLEESCHALDETQLAVLEGLQGNERMLVEGGAGSGKTLLAAEAARRHAAGGARVLLLCFTEPLRKWLAVRLEGVAEVQTVSGLARALVEEAGETVGPGDLTASERWQAIYERAADLCQRRWDTVLVDEAQDFTFEAWVLVSQLAEGKRLWAFQDPGQGFWADRAPPPDLFGASFKLLHGRRSPPGIAALADRYLGKAGNEEAIRAAQADGTLGLIPLAEPGRAPERLAAEIDRLLAQGLQPGDIGLVSLRGQTARDSVIQLPKLGRHRLFPADAEELEGQIVADTFLRWKGLERPAILVVDLPPEGLERLGTRMHIALTRALAAARIVAAPATEKSGWPGLAEP